VSGGYGRHLDDKTAVSRRMRRARAARNIRNTLSRCAAPSAKCGPRCWSAQWAAARSAAKRYCRN